MLLLVIENSSLNVRRRLSEKIARDSIRSLPFAQHSRLSVYLAAPGRSLLDFARNDRRAYPTAAITFSSIAIGVGNAVTSIVVRVGFGLAWPAKNSA